MYYGYIHQVLRLICVSYHHQLSPIPHLPTHLVAAITSHIATDVLNVMKWRASAPRRISIAETDVAPQLRFKLDLKR